MVSPSSVLKSRKEAAEFLGIKPQTLGAWASLGRYDLRQVKVGRLSKYRLADLERFIESRSTTTTEIDG
jgi:predicted site-specific integrase-resolvase